MAASKDKNVEGEPEAYASNGNGSNGRFLRIEDKLDSLIDVSTARHLEVTNRLTAIETKAAAADRVAAAVALAANEAADKAARLGNLFWIKAGVIASTALTTFAMYLHFIHRW